MVKFITIDENNLAQRLDNFLIKTLKGVPKSKIYNIIRKGEVRVNKGRKKAEYKLQIGDIVRIPPVRVSESSELPAHNRQLHSIIKTHTLYEDEAIIALNKPSGIAVHSGSGIAVGLIEAIKEQHPHYELIHRIDRATSGILLIAKKRSVLKALQQQIIDGVVQKHYQAIVVGTWAKKQHSIDAPLLTTHNKTLVDNNGKEALSIFRPLQNFTWQGVKLSLVDIEIKTGRNHQIRVHSAYVHHPVLGDEKYGDFAINKQLKTKRMYLHASTVSFIHPLTNTRKTISAPHTFSIV